MKIGSKHEKSVKLTEQFKRRSVLSIGLLLFVLVVQILIILLISSYKDTLSEQKVAIRADLDGILNAMVNQETGLRGYITTDDKTFLAPFTSGRPQYLSYVNDLRSQIAVKSFSNSKLEITQVETRADNWYTNYALVQIKNMQTGQSGVARSDSTNAFGKSLFDSFRTTESQLEQSITSDVANLQQQQNTFNWIELSIAGLLSVIAIAILWRALSNLSGSMLEQLQTLKKTSSSLGAGDWLVRVPELKYEELNQFGLAFNVMADALQQQQEKGRQEKNFLECILHLNSVLIYSLDNLDLKACIDTFLRQTLKELDLQVGALYLYDGEHRQATLFTAQGLDFDQVQPRFQTGEGTVGRVLLANEPLYLTQPANDEAQGFVVKSMLGNIYPGSRYYLPLLSGKELLGVLGIASIFPMTENVRNILNVVVSNLASAISNIKAYQHIRQQTEELEKHSQEQRQTNTELRQQRDELTALNAALQEANQARSQFLSTMSHELRTPLASIIGFSQILLDDAETINFTSLQKSNLGRISKNGKHLLALINDVLDLAKVEAGRMDVNYSQVDLQEIISSVVEETQSIAIERRLTLSYDIEKNVTIETDPMKLRQILLNLISNALKFTAQGSVTVSTTLITASQDEKECVAIAVKDMGIGIAPEEQERIFEAFYQADRGNTRKFGGTGLGLSIVRQFTTLLGGTLAVASTPGQGSTFTITLPLSLSEYQTKQEYSRLSALPNQAIPTLLSPSYEMPSPALDKLFEVSFNKEGTGTQENVVIAVDDNPDVLILIQSALEKASFKVVGVQNPIQAIEIVHKVQPCAITLDVMMPDLNGWQILHQLKTDPATATIPIVMLTVVNERTTGYVLGADEYLIKPFKNGVLVDTIQRLISSRHLSQDQELAEQQV